MLSGATARVLVLMLVLVLVLVLHPLLRELACGFQMHVLDAVR
jgi:hypothetical protein